MRIISDFKDYYDCIQRTGQDVDFVYLRRRNSDVKVPWLQTTDRHGGILHLQWQKKPVYSRCYLIGFCGKVYPCVQIKMWNEDYRPALEDPIKDFVTCYKIEEIDNFFRDNFKEKEYNFFKTKKLPWGINWWRSLNYESFEAFFENNAKMSSKYQSYFEEAHSPIFVLKSSSHRPRSQKVVWNDSLQELEFFKVFDPYSAFQEIQMFLGSLASPEKEIPEMSDDIKAYQKGFDEWSFRKPSKKGS